MLFIQTETNEQTQKMLLNVIKVFNLPVGI